ncbi:hypothetical protein VPH35_085520 [Triticum aestivum]
MRMLYCRTVAAMLAEALGCGFVQADDNHSRANKGDHSGKEHLVELQEKDALNLIISHGMHSAQCFRTQTICQVLERVEKPKVEHIQIRTIGRLLYYSDVNPIKHRQTKFHPIFLILAL